MLPNDFKIRSNLKITGIVIDIAKIAQTNLINNFLVTIEIPYMYTDVSTLLK